MAFPYEDIHGRTPPMRRPPMNQTRRSWTNNGVHFTMETSSYSGPGFSFENVTGSSGVPFPSFFAPSQPQPRPQGNGLLGTAFGLLGEALFSTSPPPRRRRQSTGGAWFQDTVDDADRFAKEEDAGNGRSRGLLNKFAEKVLSNTQNAREPPPAKAYVPRQANTDRRSRPHRTDSRANSRRSYVEEFDDDNDPDGLFDFSDETQGSEESEKTSSDDSAFEKPQRAFTANDADPIQALQRKAERHKRAMQKCHKRFEHASRRQPPDTALLQSLLNELKAHENAFKLAEKETSELRSSTRRRPSQSESAQRSRTSHQRHPPRTPDNPFSSTYPANGFNPFHQSPQNFSRFNAFGSVPTFPFGTAAVEGDPFAEFAFRAFGTSAFGTHFHAPGASFSYSSRPRSQPRPVFTAGSNGPHFQPHPSYMPFSPPPPPPPPQPPVNLLKQEEAKRLFQTYNERWNSLSPTDPNVPYPARGFNSTALITRDSIWAPHVNSPIASWSEETVMQANTQAFFLGVVGLSPQYSETGGTGRIVMTFNKVLAKPDQVKALVDMLKKEKTRWHSDRLGRRNGGLSGPNEALQRDEKARAVFHAVCELMEAAAQ